VHRNFDPETRSNRWFAKYEAGADSLTGSSSVGMPLALSIRAKGDAGYGERRSRDQASRARVACKTSVGAPEVKSLVSKSSKKCQWRATEAEEEEFLEELNNASKRKLIARGKEHPEEWDDLLDSMNALNRPSSER
jgi:hypothetical protein